MSKTYQPGQGYSQADWDAVDSPELTDVELRRARPFAEVLPELAAAIRKRGPARTKEAVSIRLDIDLVQKLRASGPGWQSRVNEALRRYLESGAV